MVTAAYLLAEDTSPLWVLVENRVLGGGQMGTSFEHPNQVFFFFFKCSLVPEESQDVSIQMVPEECFSDASLV